MNSFKSEEVLQIIDSHTELIKDLFQLIKAQESKIKSLSEQIAKINDTKNNVRI